LFSNVKLKKSEKRIINLAILVIVVVSLLQFVVLPISNSYKQLQNKKKTQISSLTKIIKKIKESKNAANKLKTVKSSLKKYKNKAFKADSIELGQVDLEEKVTTYAKNNELEIKRRYQEKAKNVGFGYTLLATRFTVKGKLENIINLMKDIQDDPMIMYIAGFTIRSYRGYEANLEIRGLLKRGE
jgi:acyl-CoA synthetase (NDP forming)